MLNPETTLNLIKYSTVCAVFLISAGAFIILPVYTALGLSLGVLVGGINYLWLEEVVEEISMADKGKKRIILLTVKYFLRLVLIGAVVCVIILNRHINIIVTVSGYTIPLFVILVVGITSIFIESNSNAS